jgi:fluoride exporter
VVRGESAGGVLLGEKSLLDGSPGIRRVLAMITGYKMLLVMVGGGLGAASRYGVGLLTVRFFGPHFPWGTLMVNLIGCFAIGVLFALVDRYRLLTPDLRLLLITGYLGALTTFSAFSLETVNAGRAGLVFQSLGNILINNIGCLTLTYLGLRLGGLR